MRDIVNKLRDAREKTELTLIKSELLKEQHRLEKLRDDLEEREESIDEYAKYEARDVEYHSQGYAAFFNTRMEKDKSILTLSVVGIGYLATFAKLGDDKLIGLEFFLFCIASLSFLTSIIVVIHIFKINADYITAILGQNPQVQQKAKYLGRRLKFADRIVFWSFILGLVSTIIMGYIASSI
ncbi:MULTISPECIES: hypothetical protein [Vibrio]|uniref:hypothetical protein n=1 Tax=Vibrio TaxID=662 RepID=UPI0003785E67|nr:MULTISPECIES: hypothetical protein [Vibrio]OEE88322.1 hypothetical protein A140_06915 [Vibrio crassostreae 9ZC88]PTP45928.1 hypothetical protein CWN87_02130 [Vibrio splendidus]